MSGRMLRIALLGQPNVGKSTIFNAVAGIRARTSNLPGTTVKVAESPVKIDGEEILLVDLPGTYSLVPLDPAQREVLNYLTENPPDAVVLVLDATALSRGLELVAEAFELGIPAVICLNLWDQVARKGIRVDARKLSELLGVPVLTCSGLQGKGVAETIREAVRVAREGKRPKPVRFSKHVEEVVAEAERLLGSRFRAIKALEGVFDEPRVKPLAEHLRREHGSEAWEVIAAERHHFAMKTAEAVTELRKRRVSWSERVDSVVMHPWLGLFLAGLFFAFSFWLIFKFGAWLEELSVGPLEELFGSWLDAASLPPFVTALLKGLADGVVGGLGIALPYFLPLIFFMALAEDLGYLPRVAHLMDGLMHRIGLHGKAVVPFILGYGCSVPAVAAVRLLESRRDRVLAGMLAPLVPCGARTAVILGLVGYFLGFWWALGVYALNILVIAAVGALLSKLVFKGESWGMAMEIPPYRLPSLRSVWFKVWLQLREFLLVAMPLLILGSGLMGLLELWRVSGAINFALSPLTKWVLSVPEALGSPIFFGFFRKELALVMTAQALGVSAEAVGSVLTPLQMASYTVFVVLYIPCLATLLVLWRELGGKVAGAAAGLSVGVAAAVGGLVRLVGLALGLS